MGEMHKKSIVKLEAQQGMIVFIVNIIWPGVGTMYAGFLNKDALMNNVIVGFLQMFLCCILVGYFWSVYTGYLIYCESKK